MGKRKFHPTKKPNKNFSKVRTEILLSPGYFTLGALIVIITSVTMEHTPPNRLLCAQKGFTPLCSVHLTRCVPKKGGGDLGDPHGLGPHTTTRRTRSRSQRWGDATPPGGGLPCCTIRLGDHFNKQRCEGRWWKNFNPIRTTRKTKELKGITLCSTCLKAFAQKIGFYLPDPPSHV